MTTSENLFSVFEPLTREPWRAKAIQDLRGADFEKLVWKTDEGFRLEPFYTAEDLYKNEALTKQHSIVAKNSGNWINYAQIEVDDFAVANALAVEMISFGATGILFQFEKKLDVDFQILLKN